MTKPRRTPTLAGATLSLALVASLAACGGGGAKKSATPTATPSTSAVTTSTSSAAAAPAPAVNPFTGNGPSKNRVVAVKIDDTANGRPQVNIDRADVVYVEQVEGGLTRLLAVYNTQLPTVEAVRSVRANDPELLAQYGPIAFVASGGAPNPLFVLDHSNLRTSINDRGGPGFARDGNRGAPYNLTANLATVANTLRGAAAKSIGWTFSAQATGFSRTPRVTAINTVVGATGVSFQWNSATKRYERIVDGSVAHSADGRVISTPNVIVQFCQVTPYPQDVDVVGNVAQFTHTIGTGHVVVFRDGRRIDGTWTRKSATAGTTFRAASGVTIPLQKGGAWVLLVATNAPLH